MSLKSSSRVWEELPLAGNDLLLMLAIADYADDEGSNAYPSRQTLARKTRLDCSTVRRRIRALEHKGHLLVARGVVPGRRTNMYTIVFPATRRRRPTTRQPGEQGTPEHQPTTGVDNPARLDMRGVDNSGDKSRAGEAQCLGAECPGGTDAPLGEAQLRPIEGGTVPPPEPSLTVPEPSPDARARAPHRHPFPGVPIFAGATPATDHDRTAARPQLAMLDTADTAASGASDVAAEFPPPDRDTTNPGAAASAQRQEGATDGSDAHPTPESSPSADHDSLDVAETVLTRLGRAWPLTDIQRRRLAPRVNDAILAGWTVTALVRYLAAHPAGVRAPYAVLSARLEQLPRPRSVSAKHTRPPWCGDCDETTRHVELRDGRAARCPACHPLRESP